MKKSLISKILGSSSGAALIQVIMASTAIMTGSLYMSMQNNVSLKSIGGEYYAMELFIFEERLKEVLVDNVTCREFFGGDDLGAPGTSIPVAKANLTSSRYGLIASSADDDAIQASLNIGQNGMFRVMGLRVRRGLVTATPPYGEFGVLEVDIGITSGAGGGRSFREHIIGPEIVKKFIPLFVAFNGATNAIADCYHDPGDTDPTDGVADGQVTAAIRSLCTAPAGSIGPQFNTDTSDCYTPGLDLTYDETTGLYVPPAAENGTPGEGQTVYQLSVVDKEFKYHQRGSNGQMEEVNLGPQPAIVYSYTNNPAWIPDMPTCPTGQMMNGFVKSPTSTGLGVQYSYDCSGLTAAELQNLVDSSVVNDCVNDFEIVASPSGVFQIQCREDEANVSRAGGGTAAPTRAP